MKIGYCNEIHHDLCSYDSAVSAGTPRRYDDVLHNTWLKHGATHCILQSSCVTLGRLRIRLQESHI